MRKSVLGSIAVTAIGLAVSTAWAAELGSLTVYSAAGEPLRAQLTVKDVDATQSPRVRLAPASLYNRVGKPLVIPVSDLTLKLESTNPYTLSIVSKNAVDANTFPLIVELSQGNDRSAKLYNVTLKERAAAPKEPVKEAVKAPAPAARTAAAPKIPSAIPSAQKAPEAAKGAAPAVAAIPSAQPQKPAATDVRPMQPIVKPAEKPAVRTAQAAPEPNFVPAMPKVEPQKQASAAADDLYPNSVDTRKPFTVESGMTMWSIAKLFKADYPDATMDQLLVAFVRDNPRNFERGRVNGVRVGSTLRAPRASTVNRVTVDEAWALVRVNPNADARKSPSPRDLKRAQDRMKKASPALYKEVQARLAKERAAAQKLAAEKKAAAEKKRLAELEAQKAQEQKAAAAAAATTAAPAAAAATQDNDPLAATIEATSKGETPAQAQGETAAQTKPAETTTQSQSTEQKSEAPAGDTVVKAEPEESSMSAWLIALIVALVAAIAGAAAWLVNRNRKQREADQAALRTVNFMKAAPTADEQIKGAEAMVANRIEADAAAARGFDVKRETTPAAQTQVEQKTEPSFASAAEAEQKPAEEPAQPVAQTAVQSAEPAQTAPASSGFNVASAFVGDDAALKSENSSQNNHDIAAGKLINARKYIGVGGYDQAARVLHEVLLVGNEEQCRQARELLAQIESRKAES